MDKTQVELIEAALRKGQMIVVGEFRGAAAETINYIAKSGPNAGKAASFSRVKYTCELGDGVDGFESVTCSVSTPDGQDPKNYILPFKRGARVLIVAEALSVSKGVKEIKASTLVSFGTN